MKKNKKFISVGIILVLILFAGFNVYNALANSEMIKLRKGNIEALANGEDSSSKKKHIDNPQSCTIVETYECVIGFRIPDWVPFIGGFSCEYNYIDEVEFPGMENHCIYTGNEDHSCDYYTCTKNGE